MKRFCASALVLAGLGLISLSVVPGEAVARGPNHASRYYSPTVYKTTALQSYPHHQLSRYWSSWYWNRRFGCYFYWYPSARCYYYWYAPRGCYYPISYLSTYPPAPVSYDTSVPATAPVPLPIQVTNVQQNANTNASPGGMVPGPITVVR